MNRNDFSIISISGHGRIVEILLRNKARINSIDNDGNSTLHVAAANGKSNFQHFCEVLHIHSLELKSQKIDRKKRMKTHSFDFCFFSINIRFVKGKENVVRLLIEHGADVNLRNKFNETALLTAVDHRR